jgi:hypothetical protein
MIDVTWRSPIKGARRLLRSTTKFCETLLDAGSRFRLELALAVEGIQNRRQTPSHMRSMLPLAKLP